MSKKVWFWATLVSVIVFSIIVNQFFFDTKGYQFEKILKRDILEISSIFAVLLLEWYFVNKYLGRTLYEVWLLFYGGSFVFLIVAALIDHNIFTISRGVQYRFFTLKSLLVSPIPLLAIVLFERIISFQQKHEMKGNDRTDIQV
jgi:hypothetical protein